MSVQSGNWTREQNFDTPSLNLDFVNGKGVDSRLRTTRVGTTSVCTDAGYVQLLNSNTAGIHWYPGTTPYSSTNPPARECLGLQIDPPRTNEYADTTFEYLIQGEGDSSVSGGTVSFSGIGPDGVTDTALRFAEDTSNGTHLINQTWTAQNGETGQRTFTASAWVKPGPSLPSGRRIRLRAGGAGSIFAGIWWDPETNDVTQSANGGAEVYDYGLEVFTDGWVRLHMTASFNDSSTATGLILQSTDGTTTSFTGDTDAVWFIWGPQFETGGGIDIGTGETEQGWQHTGYIRNYSPDNHNASRSEQRTYMDLIKYRGLINTQWNSPQNRIDNAWVFTGFVEVDMRTAQKFNLDGTSPNKNYGVFKLCNESAYNSSQGFCFLIKYSQDQVSGKLIDVNKDFLFKARHLSGISVPGPTISVRGLSSGNPQNTQCNVNPGVFSFTASLNKTSAQDMRLCSKRVEAAQIPTADQVQTVDGNDTQVLAFGGINLAVIQNDGKLPYVGWIKKFTMWPVYIPDDAAGDEKLKNLSQGF